jgi:hypothetical protein
LPTEAELVEAIKGDGRFGAALQVPCKSPPLGCGEMVTPVMADPSRDGRAWDNPPPGRGRGFRDLLSLREWQITGLCQGCQDEVEKALKEEVVRHEDGEA